MALILPQKKCLTLEAARIALAAAEAEALRNHWKVVIAVVDDGGHTILLARLDGAQWSSIVTAVEKARAAVAWKRPSSHISRMILVLPLGGATLRNSHDPSQNKGTRPARARAVRSDSACTPVFRSATL